MGKVVVIWGLVLVKTKGFFLILVLEENIKIESGSGAHLHAASWELLKLGPDWAQNNRKKKYQANMQNIYNCKK